MQIKRSITILEISELEFHEVPRNGTLSPLPPLAGSSAGGENFECFLIIYIIAFHDHATRGILCLVSLVLQLRT